MKKATGDIIPTEKRSIRDIPLPRKKDSVSVIEKKPVTVDIQEPPVRPKSREKAAEVDNANTRVSMNKSDFGRPKKGKSVWLLAFIAIIAVVLCITWVMSKTTVNVKIKSVVIPVEGMFSAIDNATDESMFTFDTIELTADLSKIVDATGEKEVSSKAAGTVILYNNFGAAPQALVAGTRIETPEGLIYKLNSPVTIPAKKTVAGKAVPGSIEAKVTAESAGDKYNIALSDFTIPGFKGTPKFNGFYARSKTPMIGGAFGTVAVIDPEVLTSTRKLLQEELVGVAIAKLKAELPEQFVFVDGSLTSSYKSSEPAVSSAGKASIKEEIAIKGFIFKQKNFITALAKEAEVALIADSTLDLDTTSLKVLSVEQNGQKAVFKFDGVLRGTYSLNEMALKAALKGQKKKEVPKLLTGFPIIEKAQVIVSPFWISSLPSSEKKIHIVMEGAI